MTNQTGANQGSELKGKFSPVILTCCAASRQFIDKEVVFGGVGVSFLAVAISKLRYTPCLIMVTEAGYVDFAGVSSMGSPADNHGAIGATLHQGLFDMFRDLQSEHINAACLGLAQVDKYGNANVSYVNPNIRMNGSGGGCDIASSAGRVVYVVKYAARTFKEKLDYITNPGYLDGSPDARKKAGLVGGGPECLVTERGIFRFDEKTHEMYLAEVFPWQDEQDIESIKADVPWDLKVADNLKIIEPPTQGEIDAISLMDPGKAYLEDSILNRPVALISMSGRRDLNAYREIAEIFRAKFQQAKDYLL
jgi:glutaconate CoA-transferase subunit B